MEGLDSLSFSANDADRALSEVREGRPELIEPGLEAIIRRFGRPAYFVRNDDFDTSEAVSSSKEVDAIIVRSPSKLVPYVAFSIVGKRADGTLNHDATTLGGNSGSVVLDLDSGKAAALHFGGLQGETNYAVSAPVVAELMHQHVLA